MTILVRIIFKWSDCKSGLRHENGVGTGFAYTPRMLQVIDTTRLFDIVLHCFTFMSHGEAGRDIVYYHASTHFEMV